MIFLGIDPGQKGGWAQIRTYPNGQVDVMVFPWDNEMFVDFMRDVPVDFETTVCALEKVGAMPGQGVRSMFSFGESYGFIQGVLSALRIPYQLVPPTKWKKEFSLIGKDKQASIITCHRLFPDLDLRWTEKCKTDSDGLAESTLLAEYARRRFS